MNKRHVALTLSALMALSASVGCGKSGESATTQAAINESGTSMTAKKTDTEAQNNASVYIGESGYFPLKEKKKIKIAGVRDDKGRSFAEVKYFQDLQAATNVEIDWLDWPQLVQKEKRSLAFASGTLPDAFYGSWSMEKNDVVKYGNEKQLLDFTPYLNQDVMPNVSRLFSEVEGLKKALQVPTGELYVLSTLDQNDLPTTNDTLLINREWLKKVNKTVPTTLDEFVDVLKAFKAAGDLNGNGDADEIPFSFLYNDGNNGAFGLMGFTGIPMENKNVRMVMKDGQPAFAPALDEYKTYLKFLNRLQQEGLLDPEIFTMDQPTYNAKTQTATPTIGVLSSWSAEQVNKPIAGFDTAKEGTYVYVAPLKGAEGVAPKWGRRFNPLNGNLSFAASAGTADPELIARWIDLAYDPMTSINNYVGVVGKHIKAEGANAFSHILTAEGKRHTKVDMIPDVPGKFCVAWVQEGAVKWTDAQKSVQDKKAAHDVYSPYFVEAVVNDSAMPTQEENERLSQLTTDILAYVDQMTAQFVTTGGIDDGWQGYLDQLNKLGLDEYIKIRTAIHNRAKA